jgi:putative hydrolase of the HAD superfamily
MTIRAILFDLDNTIYPATSGVMQQIDRRIGEFVMQRLGMSDTDSRALRQTYYTAYGTTLRGLQQHFNGIDTDDYLHFVHDVSIEELLRFDAQLDAHLARLDVPKVIFTNSPREHAERVLRAMGIAQHFERIYDLRYFNFVGKPDPACYTHIVEQLGVAGDEALLLEDTPHNLAPARQLGMTTMLITDATFECPEADYIVPDVFSALEIAEKLIKPRLTVLPQPQPRLPLRRSA